MNIQTKFHGEIEIQHDQTWNFPKGIPGFEEEKEFVLLPIEGNDIFQVLQSTKTSDVAFIVANPYTLVEDYSFNIDEPTIELLNIKKEEDVFVLGVLTKRTIRNINHQFTSTTHLPTEQQKSKTNDYERQYILICAIQSVHKSSNRREGVIYACTFP